MAAPRFAYVGADTPRELILAAGLTPVRLSGWEHAPGDDLPSNLSARSKSLVAQLLDPHAGYVGAAIAHGCAEDVQLFATLRELGRTGRPAAFPISFIDLLHSPGEAITAYNLARLAQFKQALEALTGAPISDAAIAGAIAAENGVKTRLTSLFERRALPSPTLSGTQALGLVRQMSRLPADEADQLLGAAKSAISTPHAGSLLLVTGSAHEAGTIYAAIEAAGAVIIGEDHDWGELWLANRADEAVAPLQALASRPQTRPTAGPTASSLARARRLASRAATLRLDAVLHLRIDGDEAAPWDLWALRQALSPLEIPLHSLSCSGALSKRQSAALQEQLADLITTGTASPTSPRPRPAPSPARSPAKAEAGRRSRKALACTLDFSEWQRAWFIEVRQQAANGPFAVVNADAPQELLRAMDIPYVVNQWWAAIVAAKQKSRAYGDLLKAAGYPAEVESYSAQGLAAALDRDDQDPPWGGLPDPDLLSLTASTDAGPKLFEAWANLTGARLEQFERTVESRWDIPIDWWDQMPTRWAAALETERLDLMTAQLEAYVTSLEALTGQVLDRLRLVEVMRLVNEQEDYYRRTRDLVAATRPAPISVVDSMPATMTPQWHRGSEWGRDAARRLFEEVSARVQAGEAAYPDEKLRLMWIGRGLWSDMGVYQRWEESHGAVFVWSMYLGLAADGYIREFEGEDDVMRALAARFLTMGDELRMPSWAGAWHVKEARLHGVAGAVAIDDADPLVIDALERAGIPVCRVAIDNMSGFGVDQENQVTAFLDDLSATTSVEAPPL